MPELPEVETTVRGIATVLEGERLTAATPRRADLRWPIPQDIGQRLTGARVTGLGRRAKYGLVHTDRGDTLIFHLGMSGRWRVNPETLEKHDHFVLETESGDRLTLYDPRRFGSLDLMATDDLASYRAFVTMGPEPLSMDFSAEMLKARLMGRKSSIKAMLLNQNIVAGLGNIYVCEALNMAAINPRKAAGGISKPKLDLLVSAIKSVLTDAIAAGGSTLRDYAQPDGELGYFAKQWRVYGREGEACACGEMITRHVDSGRSTFYCPRCQR